MREENIFSQTATGGRYYRERRKYLLSDGHRRPMRSERRKYLLSDSHRRSMHHERRKYLLSDSHRRSMHHERRKYLLSDSPRWSMHHERIKISSLRQPQAVDAACDGSRRPSRPSYSQQKNRSSPGLHRCSCCGSSSAAGRSSRLRAVILVWPYQRQYLSNAAIRSAAISCAERSSMS